MKKAKKIANGPVTLSDLRTALKPFVTVPQFEKGLKSSEARSQARYDALSRAIAGLEKNMNDKFNMMNSHIDAFMKRTETNELEIKFLGHQHDDLTKYCTQKIAYPTYGRNL